MTVCSARLRSWSRTRLRRRGCWRVPRHHGRALPAVLPAGPAFVRPRGAYLRAAHPPPEKRPARGLFVASSILIADIAVLGSPNAPHADDYKALMATATALPIADRVRHPVNFWAPARLLSLDGRWFAYNPPLRRAAVNHPRRRASSGGCLARRSSRRPGRRSGSCAPPRCPGKAVLTRASPTTCRDGCRLGPKLAADGDRLA
jgi:hypothetical protein